MKRIISVITILLVLSMTLVMFAGCSAQHDERLVGVWYAGGFYTTLNADGSGSDGQSALAWWTNGDYLLWCLAPNTCGNFRPCANTVRWTFTLRNYNNNLELVSGNHTVNLTRVVTE